MIDLKPYYQVKLTLLTYKASFSSNPPKTENEKYADGRNSYTAVAKHGGVITMNGQHLRIKYITNEEGENIILYISEIG